ncbi:MAG: hypothetical protein ACP5G0_11350 [Desulfomonilia bacterium]
MSGANALDLLDIALSNEKMEMEFFLHHATKIQNPLEKEIFQEYADEVRKNYLRLKTLKESISKKASKQSVAEPSQDSAIIDFDYEEKLTRDIDRALADYDDFRVIEAASDLLETIAEFFTRHSETLSDPTGKELFKAIADIKRENLLHLKDIEEYLKDPGSWFAELEHHGLDGA